MMRDFSDMTPAEIETWLHEANREEMERRYEENRKKAKGFVEYEKAIYEALMRREQMEREIAITGIRTECMLRVGECRSHFEAIDAIRAAMDKENALASEPSQYATAYSAACTVCGRIDSEIESESVATHTDTVSITPTCTPRSRMESLALVSVCAVISLVLILAIAGVLAVAR